MNKYNNPRLLNTVVSGTGMKNPVRPHVIIGSEENGFIRGDLMDANAIQELIVTEIAAREHGDEELTEYIDEKVQLAVDDLVDGAPEVLDTLKELSEALGDDANFATTITEEIASKVDKVEGKGLSTNDYTNAEKQKLAGIAAGAEVNVQSDWSLTNSSNDSFIKNKPTKLSQFTNDVPYATQDYIINNFETKTRVTELKQSIKEKIDNIESVLPKDVESETFVPVASKDDVEELKENLTFTETTDPANGHAYVEIGGIKWATMNVGATSETDYGLYFQWGDTQGYTAEQVGSGEGQKTFGWVDYKYGNGTNAPSAANMTKYNATDGKTVLDIEDDAARANMGGQWRMPTTSELQALGNAVNAVWTTNYNGSGINGVLCTDKNDSTKKLFFPAAGYRYNSSVVSVGKIGIFWSSSLYANSRQRAYSLRFFSGHANWCDNDDRFYGYAVRGVLDRGPETTITPVKEVVTDLKSNEEVIAAALNNLNTKIEATNIRFRLVPILLGLLLDFIEFAFKHIPKFSMSSNVFDKLFTELDSTTINDVMLAYAPTFYVGDPSGGVVTCSIVRSATQVCVFRNRVNKQSGAAIQECRLGTIGVDSTITWDSWMNMSSTISQQASA